MSSWRWGSGLGAPTREGPPKHATGTCAGPGLLRASEVCFRGALACKAPSAPTPSATYRVGRESRRGRGENAAPGRLAVSAERARPTSGSVDFQAGRATPGRGTSDVIASLLHCMSEPMIRFVTQVRVLRALLDFISGLDPSAVGLLQALLALVPTRNNGESNVGFGRPRSSTGWRRKVGGSGRGTRRLDPALLVRQLSNYVRRTRQAGTAGARSVRAHCEGAGGPAALRTARSDREQRPVPVSPVV